MPLKNLLQHTEKIKYYGKKISGLSNLRPKWNIQNGAITLPPFLTKNTFWLAILLSILCHMTLLQLISFIPTVPSATPTPETRINFNIKKQITPQKNTAIRPPITKPKPSSKKTPQKIKKTTPAPLPAPLARPKKPTFLTPNTHTSNPTLAESNLATRYEQMLPLWLDRFRHTSPEAKRLQLRGSGDILIHIDRLGNILEAKISRSTGHPLLDQALRTMLEDANPVIPVPQDYAPNENSFFYEITFQF